MSNPPGRLYVVATPIGNLGDISARAVETLNAVDVICAEDTRHSAKLLAHLGIQGNLKSLHEHNELSRIQMLLTHLKEGRDLALISDAGTPLISDPGYALVRDVRAAGIEVMTVPGPCSVVAALSVAGLPTDRFFFEGFLPARSAARRARLVELARLPYTLVLFESGRRLRATLADLLASHGGDHQIAICRELTKRFETTVSGSLDSMLTRLDTDPNADRGEFVLVLAPGQAASESTPAMPVAELLALLRAEGLGAKSAARVAASLTGESVNALYKQAAQAGGD